MPRTVLQVIILTVIVQSACLANRVTCSLDALYEHATALEVGIMMALFAIVPALAAIRVGLWIDAVGPRKPILCGISLITATLFIPIVFTTQTFGLLPLYVTCTLNGFALMFIYMSVQQTVGHLSTVKNRTTNFAYLALGQSAANLLAPIVAGQFIDRTGMASAFWFAAVMAVIALLTFTLFIRRSLPLGWGAPKLVNRKGNFELLTIPHVRNVLVASSFMSMAWDLQGFMIPVYGTAIGLSAGEVGWILGVFASATFFVRLLMPMIARRLTEWQTITAAFAVGAVAYALFPIFENFYTLAVIAFLLGLALGSSQPNVMSLIHTESPAGRTGEALGLRTMLLNICHTTLPIVFGAAGNAIGAGAVFYIVAGIMGGVSVFTSKCEKQSVSRAHRRVVEALKEDRKNNDSAQP